jgi:endonuclease-8
MPEGDTVLHAALQIRAALGGVVPEEVLTPQRRHGRDRIAERLSGLAVTGVDTHGKHLFLHFNGGWVIHSHLGMSGSWRVYERGAPWRRSSSRAWLVLRAAGVEVVEFDGPLLELITATRRRSDQRLAALGPDVLAPEFDADRFLLRLRADDQSRTFGDALLDQRTVAGIGNIWKAEGCWEAHVDPWKPLRLISDAEALAVVRAIRPRMLRSAQDGPPIRPLNAYARAGRPCSRCGKRIEARGQGDANRTTYWCPGCQG